MVVHLFCGSVTEPENPSPAAYLQFPEIHRWWLMGISRAILALFFIAAGVNHFISPHVYLPLIPGYLPFPEALVFLSGVAEVIGGLGVIPAKSRRLAGWWLIAVLVAIFPANLHMLAHDVPISGKHLPAWMLWARLPLQALMMIWVYVSCLSRRVPQPPVDRSSNRL